MTISLVIIFWIVVAIMVAGVLLLLAVPLLRPGKSSSSATVSEVNLSVYRDQLRELDAELAAGTLDQAQYDNARSEMEGRVLQDVGTGETTAASPVGGRWPKPAIVALALAVPVVAVALYLVLGTPAGLEPQPQAEVVEQSHQVTPQQIEAMVERLAKRLESEPDDAAGWTMLARSYVNLRRFDQASIAYARAAKLLPDNAHVLADYADALAVNIRTLQGEPEKIIQQALKADPNHIKALMLAGSASFERKDYRDAIGPWQKVLKLLPPNSQMADSITGSINEAREKAGLPPLVSQANNMTQNNTTQTRPGAAGAAGTVSGTVKLDPAFKALVLDTDAVFIFARSSDRPTGPPLAALRKKVSDLPLTFTLDDSMAMMPSLNLSSATSVVITVRISKSGNVTANPGDMQGFSQPVKVGTTGISVTINEAVQ